MKTKMTKTEAKRQAELLRVKAVQQMGAVASGNQFAFEELLRMGGEIALGHVAPGREYGCGTDRAVEAMRDLLNAKGGYRPTLREDQDPALTVLADIYDFCMARCGDPRRAYRGC